MSEEQRTAPGAAADEEPPEAAASAPAREPRPGKRRARPKQPLLTESQIDSPDRLTLVLLGIVFGVSVLSWGAARFACNLQAPASRAPSVLPTTALAGNPKDAAIELQQRWRTQDYAGALELAKGPLVPLIEADRRQCESHGVSECERKRDALQREVVTTAVLVSKDERTAEARVTSYLGQTKETYVLRVEQDGAIWKGVSRRRE